MRHYKKFFEAFLDKGNWKLETKQNNNLFKGKEGKGRQGKARQGLGLGEESSVKPNNVHDWRCSK